MKIKMNGMVAIYHNLHIFGSESHHVLYHLLLSFSSSPTIHVFQNFSCARYSVHLPFTYYVHSCSALFCTLSLPRLASFYIYMYLYLYRQIFSFVQLWSQRRCPVYLSNRLLFPLLIR